MKKKVVMIVRTSVFHDSRVLREAKALLDAGYNISIIGMKDTGKEPSKSEIDGIPIYLLKVQVKNLLPVSMIGWLFKYLEFMVKVVVKTLILKPDIIHSHDLDGLVPGYLAKLFVNSKLIYDSHELYTETASIGTSEKKIAMFLEKNIIHKCDKVFTVSPSIAIELEKRYLVKKVETVLNCPSSCGILRKTDNIRKLLLISEDVPIVIYQGGIQPRRGLETLVKAMDFIPKGVLVFMGSGLLVEPLRKEMKRLAGRFFIIDPVPPKDIIEWTSSADIGIAAIENSCLNYYYCMPNKLFEYIQAGLPVVVSDFPDMGAIVDKYRIGERCNPADPKSIAEAINKIIGSYEDYSHPDKCSEIMAEFNWEKQSEKLLSIYNEITIEG